MQVASPQEYIFSDQIGHLLRRAYQRHAAIFQQTVPDSQLTAAQFVVLCAVRDGEPSLVSAVVQATAIDEASVRGIVERLKWRELLAVASDPGDGRKMTLSLTPEGRAMIEKTIPFAQQISEHTFGNLDSSQRATIMDLLRKMSGA